MSNNAFSIAENLNKEDKVNSHIQMPKCILKQFMNEQKSFYYFDVNETAAEKKIKLGHPKSLNTKFGYYSVYMEKKLQNAIESPLGRKIKYIINNDFLDPVDTPLDFQNVAKSYTHSLIARSPHMYKTLEKYSIMLKLINTLTDTEKNDLAVELVMREADQNSPFNNYIVTMVINKTEIPFLLPICGMYSYGDFICAPISPNRAIALVKIESNLCESLIKDRVCKVLLIERDDILHRMNLFAITSELNHNKQYVVSPKKELLQMYLKQLSLT